MRASWAVLPAVLLLAACGGGDEREPEEPPMKPEDTVFGDLYTAPGKVQDRTDAAMEAHREALEARLEADEGAPPEE